MKFNKIYNAPFVSDGHAIWTHDGVHALDVEDAVWSNGEAAAKEIITRVVDLLNGKIAQKFENVTWKGTNSDCVILLGGVALLEIRGWDYLTGAKGLNSKVAAHIQDEFASWVVSKISK